VLKDIFGIFLEGVMTAGAFAVGLNRSFVP